MMTLIRCAVVALILTPAPGAAQDYDAGLDAYRVGDYATALQEWTPLAEEGVPEAQLGLARMYFDGHGVPRDYAKSARWYHMVAEQNLEEFRGTAEYHLGVFYEFGQGVPQDDTEAVRWYRLAAEQGNGFAKLALERLYPDGKFMPKEVREAQRLRSLRRTRAQSGQAFDQYALGVMYYNGQGVPQDYVTAHMWFNIAAANGNDKARENRDKVAGRMTADAIAEAQQRAWVCMASDYQDCD